MKEGLARVASSTRLSREVRGMGLMLALETRIDIHDILLNSIRDGVIFAYSGRETVRFLPPLVIEDRQIEKGLEVLRGALGEEEKKRLGPR